MTQPFSDAVFFDCIYVKSIEYRPALRDRPSVDSEACSEYNDVTEPRLSLHSAASLKLSKRGCCIIPIVRTDLTCESDSVLLFYPATYTKSIRGCNAQRRKEQFVAVIRKFVRLLNERN